MDKMPLGTEVGLGLRDIMLDGNPAPPPQNRGHVSIPTLFGAYLLWPNGRPFQQLLSSCSIFKMAAVCHVRVWATREKHLVVFIGLQNMIGFDAV